MARLVFRNGPYSGKSLQIPDGKTITMGRSREIELPLPDLKLSRKHCQLAAVPEGFVLRDLGSTNGTYLNGQRVQGESALRHFDRLLLGDTEIEFQCPETLDKIETAVGAPDPSAKAASAAAPALGGGLKLEAESEDGFELEPTSMVEKDEPEIIPAAQESGSNRGILGSPAGAPAPVSDPVAVALLDVDRTLPETPPELPFVKRNLNFCDGCDGSIPEIDCILERARHLDGKLLCRECLAKNIGGETAALPPAQPPLPAPVTIEEALAPRPAPKPAQPEKKELDLDKILKGLDNSEPEVVEVNKPKWMLEKERAQAQGGSGSGPVIKPGASSPQPKPAGSGASPKPPVPVPKPAAPPAPKKTDDDDLVEIE